MSAEPGPATGEPATTGPATGDPATTGPATGEPAIAEVLDCRGQRCPLPVIALAKRLPALHVGATIRVLADDPAAANDVPAWCRLRGQAYLGATTVDGVPAFDVRRLT